MKRIISIGIYLISCICLVAQTTKTYTLTFDENDFSFIKSENGDYIISDTQPLCYGEDMSLPEIPYLEVNILLPENCICDGFSYNINDSVLVEKEIALKANSGLVPMSELASIPAHKGVYPLINYPFEIKMIEEGKLCGYRYVALKVSPFTYNAKEKRLKYASDIDLIVKMKDAYLPHPATTFYSKESIELMIKDMVINPEEFYRPKQREVNARSSNTGSNFPVKYLIVTSESLKNAFQPLANWKTAKGVKANIETVEDIYRTYTGTSNQIKIKKCIYDYYQQGLEYVLIGGDVDIVPVQGCYGKATDAITPKEVFDIPTDLFYSLYEGNFYWNADGDSIIGEIEDSVYFKNDASAVAVARIPVSSEQAVGTFIEKTINYELNAPTTGHNKVLLVGNETAYSYNGHSDAELNSLKLYNQYIKKYLPNAELSFIFDTNTSHADSASYELNATNLQTQLAQGFHHIHVETHGTPNSWVLENGFYYSFNAQSLCNNNVPSIMLTTSCFSNAFDKPYDCLSEAFIKNSQSGVVAFLGSSREGWGIADEEIPKFGKSILFNRYFYESLFRHKINRFGKAVASVKKRFDSQKYSSTRWVFFSINAIGDPELPIYIESPKTIEGLSWVYKDNKLHVSTDTTEYTVTLSSKNDNGSRYYHTVADTNRYVFQNVDSLENFQLCITKDHYKPLLITDLKSHVIIQNQTFTNTSTITGDEIVIGSNVSTAVEEGPVVIESGSTTFDATNSVIIKNGFECKKGATLEIK